MSPLMGGLLGDTTLSSIFDLLNRVLPGRTGATPETQRFEFRDNVACRTISFDALTGGRGGGGKAAEHFSGFLFPCAVEPSHMTSNLSPDLWAPHYVSGLLGIAQEIAALTQVGVAAKALSLKHL